MQAVASDTREESPSKKGLLLKRDFFLLPLISVVTVLLLAGFAEGASRLFWVEQTDDACLYYDPLGVRHKPFCVSSMKNLEGPWVRYEYNACGYRGTGSCGPKPAGFARFAIMGTSFAFGLYVPEQDLFYIRAAPALRRILGRRVEFENIGTLGPDRLALQYKMINEVASLHPDGVFFIIVPFDLKRLDDEPLWMEEKKETQGHWFLKLSDLAYFGRSSRAFFVAQHIMLSDQDFAIRAFRMKSDPDDTSHVPETPLAQKRYDRLSVLIQRLSAGFRQRGIPLYVIPLPSRLQAALIGGKIQMPGVDPLAFPRRVAEIARNAGAQCIDTTSQFTHTSEPARAFYPVDGHLNAFGNQLVANAIVDYFSHNSAPPVPSVPTGAGFGN